jgi:hypothetical protein
MAHESPYPSKKLDCKYSHLLVSGARLAGCYNWSKLVAVVGSPCALPSDMLTVEMGQRRTCTYGHDVFDGFRDAIKSLS